MKIVKIVTASFKEHLAQQLTNTKDMSKILSRSEESCVSHFRRCGLFAFAKVHNV